MCVACAISAKRPALLCILAKDPHIELPPIIGDPHLAIYRKRKAAYTKWEETTPQCEAKTSITPPSTKRQY